MYQNCMTSVQVLLKPTWILVDSSAFTIPSVILASDSDSLLNAGDADQPPQLNPALLIRNPFSTSISFSKSPKILPNSPNISQHLPLSPVPSCTENNLRTKAHRLPLDVKQGRRAVSAPRASYTRVHPLSIIRICQMPSCDSTLQICSIHLFLNLAC